MFSSLDPLRTRAIPERLRGAFTTRRYTNPRLPLPLPFIFILRSQQSCGNMPDCGANPTIGSLCVQYTARHMVHTPTAVNTLTLRGMVK